MNSVVSSLYTNRLRLTFSMLVKNEYLKQFVDTPWLES